MAGSRPQTKLRSNRQNFYTSGWQNKDSELPGLAQSPQRSGGPAKLPCKQCGGGPSLGDVPLGTRTQNRFRGRRIPTGQGLLLHVSVERRVPCHLDGSRKAELGREQSYWDRRGFQGKQGGG